MFCTNCGKEVNEEMEKCPNCGNVLVTAKKETEAQNAVPKEKKSLGSKIKAVGTVLGGILLVLFLLDVGSGLLAGKSLTDIMYNPEGGGDVDPKEDSGYTYSAPEGLDSINGVGNATTANNNIDIEPEYDNTENATNQVETERPAATREMLMTAEDWEGTYRRNDGLMMSLYKNDDKSMLLTIGDETGTWIYIQDEVALLSENGAGVIYKDSYYDFVVEYSSGEDTYFITQYDNSGDDFSGTYYLK